MLKIITASSCTTVCRIYSGTYDLVVNMLEGYINNRTWTVHQQLQSASIQWVMNISPSVCMQLKTENLVQKWRYTKCIV